MQLNESPEDFVLIILHRIPQQSSQRATNGNCVHEMIAKHASNWEENTDNERKIDTQEQEHTDEL